MSKVIATRINEALLKDIDFICKVEGLDKATVIKRLLTEGLKKWKLDYAIRLYCDGKVSLWRAARIANVSLWEFIDILKEKRIELHLDSEDLEMK